MTASSNKLTLDEFKQALQDYDLVWLQWYAWPSRWWEQGVNLTLSAQKLIVGPNASPARWQEYPLKAYEQELLTGKWAPHVRAFVVHTERTALHLAAPWGLPPSKFWIMGGLYDSNLSLPEPLPYKSRTTDVLMFYKSANLPQAVTRPRYDRVVALLRQQNLTLQEFAYGSYKRSDLIAAAHNSRMALYLSWYDTGGLAAVDISVAGPMLISFPEAFCMGSDVNSIILPGLFNATDEALVALQAAVGKRPYKNARLARYNRVFYSGFTFMRRLLKHAWGGDSRTAAVGGVEGRGSALGVGTLAGSRT